MLLERELGGGSTAATAAEHLETVSLTHTDTQHCPANLGALKIPYIGLGTKSCMVSEAPGGHMHPHAKIVLQSSPVSPHDISE